MTTSNTLVERESWGSKLGFIMAAAGSAIGLGTLWKFPYVTGENGGGAFIIAYILCTLFIGAPLFVAELLLGRHAQKGSVATFTTIAHKNSSWKFVGWMGVIASFLIMSYYSVVAGWGLNYIFMSLNQFYVGLTPEQIENTFNVLERSGDISLFWHFAFTALAVCVVYRGIRNGIEHFSKWMTSLLLGLVVIIFLYNTTLSGFKDTFNFVMIPNISKLKPTAILEALGLSLFTLSLGQGIMITYGSYMRKSDDIPKTALIVSTMVTICALVCAFVVFPIIFTFNLPPQEGKGLVFKTLPILFSKLPGALFISTAFFTLFTFAALTSAIAFIEVIVASFIDLYGWSRRRATILTGIGTFLFGIPSALSGSDGFFSGWKVLYGKTFFQTIDGFSSDWLLPICGLMTAIFTGWYLDLSIVKKEFFANTKLSYLFIPWRFFVRWITPTAIILIILQHVGFINLDALIK